MSASQIIPRVRDVEGVRDTNRVGPTTLKRQRKKMKTLHKRIVDPHEKTWFRTIHVQQPAFLAPACQNQGIIDILRLREVIDPKQILLQSNGVLLGRGVAACLAPHISNIRNTFWLLTWGIPGYPLPIHQPTKAVKAREAELIQCMNILFRLL